METPTYIKALLLPNGNKPAGRKVWSIDLESVWLPFFIATNTAGQTRLAPESLGAPLRLGYEADGSVKFSKTGKPVIRVVKEIGDSVKLVRENFVAGLVAYANGVATELPEEYKATASLAVEAGKPICQKDKTALMEATLAKMGIGAEAAPEPTLEATPEATPEPELVLTPA